MRQRHGLAGSRVPAHFVDDAVDDGPPQVREEGHRIAALEVRQPSHSPYEHVLYDIVGIRHRAHVGGKPMMNDRFECAHVTRKQDFLRREVPLLDFLDEIHGRVDRSRARRVCRGRRLGRVLHRCYAPTR